MLLLVLFVVAGCSGKNSSSNASSDDKTTNSSFAIYGVNPQSAYAGAAVVITGTGFGSVQGKVKFDDTEGTISSWSDTSINVIVPDIPAGGINLGIISGSQTPGIDFTILPFISGISKTDTVLNDTIDITGTSFGPTQGNNSVNYAGTVLPVTGWSNNKITVSIGNVTHAAAGLLTLMVNDTVSNGITLTVHPAVGSLLPDTAEKGEEVAITGNLFGFNQGTSSVSFSGIPAAVMIWSDDLIKVKVPDSAVKGDVSVIINGIASSGLGFTVTKTFSSINQPTGLAMDENENIYVANYSDGTIIKVSPGGMTQTTIYKGLKNPMGIYYAPSSTLYVACKGDGTVQRLTLASQVTGYTYASGFSMPAGIAFDDAGNMYVTNYGNNTISKMDLSGTISTFATGLNKPMGIAFTGPTGGKTFKVVNNGNGSISEVNLSGVVYLFVSEKDSPRYIMSDNDFNLYITSYDQVSKVTSTGVSLTYTTGLTNAYGLVMDQAGYLYASDFDTNAISKIDKGYQVYAEGLYNPWGITFSPSGTMFIANQGSLSTGGGSISMVTTDGQVLSFVKRLNRSACLYEPGGSRISFKDITIGFQNNLFISTYSDFGASTISEVTYDGNAHLFGSCIDYAGLGKYSNISFGSVSQELYISDTQNGKLFTMTSSGSSIHSFASGFSLPQGITIDQYGKVYVANAGNGTISQTTASGTFTSTYASGLSGPAGLAQDNERKLYVSDYGTQSVSIVTPSHQVITFAVGISTPTGIALDHNGYVYVASESEGRVYKLVHPASVYIRGLNNPQGLAKGPDGLIYVADNTNNNIYRLETIDKFTKIASDISSPSWFVFNNGGGLFISDFNNGRIGDYLNNTINTFASGLSGPTGIAYDLLNNIFYVGNYDNGTLSLITSSGNVSTFAVGLSGPMGVAFLSPGNLYVANRSNGTISRVVQGSGVSTFADGFGLPAGITLDTADNLYVADQSAGMIYRIRPDGSVAAFARISAPFGVAFDGNGNLFVSDTENKQIKEIILH